MGWGRQNVSVMSRILILSLSVMGIYQTGASFTPPSDTQLACKNQASIASYVCRVFGSGSEACIGTKRTALRCTSVKLGASAGRRGGQTSQGPLMLPALGRTIRATKSLLSALSPKGDAQHTATTPHKGVWDEHIKAYYLPNPSNEMLPLFNSINLTGFNESCYAVLKKTNARFIYGRGDADFMDHNGVLNSDGRKALRELRNPGCKVWTRSVNANTMSQYNVMNTLRLTIFVLNRAVRMFAPYEKELPSIKCCKYSWDTSSNGWADEEMAELCCKSGNRKTPKAKWGIKFDKGKMSGIKIRSELAKQRIRPRCVPQLGNICIKCKGVDVSETCEAHLNKGGKACPADLKLGASDAVSGRHRWIFKKLNPIKAAKKVIRRGQKKVAVLKRQLKKASRKARAAKAMVKKATKTVKRAALKTVKTAAKKVKKSGGELLKKGSDMLKKPSFLSGKLLKGKLLKRKLLKMVIKRLSGLSGRFRDLFMPPLVDLAKGLAGKKTIKQSISAALKKLFNHPKLGVWVRYKMIYPFMEKPVFRPALFGSLIYDCSIRQFFEPMAQMGTYLKVVSKSTRRLKPTKECENVVNPQCLTTVGRPGRQWKQLKNKSECYDHSRGSLGVAHQRRKTRGKQIIWNVAKGDDQKNADGMNCILTDGIQRMTLHKCAGHADKDDEFDQDKCRGTTLCTMEVEYDVHFCRQWHSNKWCWKGDVARKHIGTQLSYSNPKMPKLALCKPWFVLMDSGIRGSLGALTSIAGVYKLRECLLNQKPLWWKANEACPSYD